VNLLALGKEPWKFRDFNDQLDTYHQQWQSDQQKQMASAKIMSAIITTVVAVAAADVKEIMDAEVADEDTADEAE
jgi:hypothetical protein